MQGKKHDERDKKDQKPTEQSQMTPATVNFSMAAATVDVSLAAKPELVIAPIIFRVSEVVWAKIKGSVPWPARIKSFPSNRMVIVVWLNDYRTTKIYRTQIFKFLTNFDTYAKNFDKTVGLKKAAQEGLMLYGSMINRDL